MNIEAVTPAAPLQALTIRPQAPDAQTAHKACKARNDRASKLRRRDASRTPDRAAALDFARRVQALADVAPDEATRSELNKIVHRLSRRVPATATFSQKRDAVLDELTRWEAMSVAELVAETGLPAGDVQVALDSLTSAAVNLVEIFTRGGKNNCGRKGTKLYYRLLHGR